MTSVNVTNFAEWRTQARELLRRHVHPAAVVWTEGAGLFADPQASTTEPTPTVPAAFLALARRVAMHRNPDRWALLYRALYRIAHGEKQLLLFEADPDVRRLQLMRKAIARDLHKMHAFVRFRRVETDAGEYFVAWYRPDNLIVEEAAPWFARRFGSMRWSILTPDACAHWDLSQLTYTPGVPRSAAPSGDDLEELWNSYYASIFNPARLNLSAMKKEMPTRHWATLPETAQMVQLIRNANPREEEMRVEQSHLEMFQTSGASLQDIAQAVRACRNCELYEHATQAVCGEGPAHARIMVVGEQPGDREDLQGRPFVGPAGRLLDRALAQAGIDRAQTYVTNAVKHFHFEERGKRRIHKTPRGIHIASCKPWLDAEIEAVQPQILVALGVTAALALSGRQILMREERGEFLPLPGNRELLVTVHPAFLLRVPEGQREAEYRRFVEDLAKLAPRLAP
jgi:DNA polymerase